MILIGLLLCLLCIAVLEQAYIFYALFEVRLILEEVDFTILIREEEQVI